MAQTIYGAIQVESSVNEANLNYDVVGKNSEIFYANEIVTLNAGLASGATGTATVLGVMAGAATMASDNQTVAKVKPGYAPADEGLFLMGADADLTIGTSEGLYFSITGATATQQISVATPGGTTGATGTGRVIEIVEVDPFNDGGTGSGSGLRIAKVRFVKTPYTNVAITA